MHTNSRDLLVLSLFPSFHAHFACQFKYYIVQFKDYTFTVNIVNNTVFCIMSTQESDSLIIQIIPVPECSLMERNESRSTHHCSTTISMLTGLSRIRSVAASS